MKKAYIYVLSFVLTLTMLVGVLPACLLSLPAAAEDYTDPNSPYVATTYTQLYNFFASASTAGKSYYVKLGKDVSYKHYEEGTLITHGGDVSLDLAGYTISYTDESNFSHRVIRGLDGKVIINDSRRYDSSKDEWITGKIDYVYTVPYNNRNTAALSGSIVMNGGRVVNRTSSDAVHSAYANVFYKDEAIELSERGSFEMYDGVFEAKTPLYLTALSEVQKIDGGVFEIKGSVGIEVRHGSAGFYTPTIVKCDILNSSGNSQAIGLKMDFAPNYTSSHTAEQAIEDLGKLVPDGTYAFVDGKKQSSLTSGITSVLYKAAGTVYGPLFSSSFVLYPSITLSELRVTLTEPKPGAALSYDAVAPEGNGYVVEAYNDDEWENGVCWKDEEGEPLLPGSVFEAGKRYTATVSIVPVNKWIYLFADTGSISGYINGRPATVKRFSSANYGLTYTFTCPEPTYIDRVDITIPTPLAGKAVSYSCTLPKNCGFKLAGGYFDSSDEHWKNCMLWSVDGENLLNDRPNTFKAGKTYTVTIALFKTNDPWFTYADTADLTATVNGMAATVYYAGCIAVSCDITIPDYTIRKLEVTVPEPAYGEKIVYDASVPVGAGYQVKNFSNGSEWEEGVCWSDDEGLLNPQQTERFTTGVDYTVEVWLVADNEYEFASLSNMTATVNGHEAHIANIAAGEYSVYYTFTVTVPPIDEIYIYGFEQPTVGQTVYDNLNQTTTPLYAPYTIAALEWYTNPGNDPLPDDYIFEEGVIYYAYFKVVPHNGCSFTSACPEIHIDSEIDDYFTTHSESIVHFFTVDMPAIGGVKKITEVNVNGYTAPVVGQTVADSLAKLSVPDGAHYSIASVEFRRANNTPLQNSHVFEAGNTYYMIVHLVADDGYFFDNADKPTVLLGGSAKDVYAPSTSVYNDGETLSFITVDFTVEESSVTYGDCNGDGVINKKDSLALKKYLSDNSNPIDLAAADVFYDGVVNKKDSLRLKQYLAGWDVTLGA